MIERARYLSLLVATCGFAACGDDTTSTSNGGADGTAAADSGGGGSGDGGDASGGRPSSGGSADGGGTVDGGGGSDTGGGGAPPCSPTRFSEEPSAIYTLPSEHGVDAFDFVSDVNCNAPPGGSVIDDEVFTLMELDGDGAADIVLYSHCYATTNAPWRFHKNTGGGFEPVHADWGIPQGYATYDFRSGSNGSCSMTDDYSYAMTDIDGDARPDIIMTNHCSVADDLGKTHWNVHLNEGDRFAPDEVVWDLPNYGAYTNFRSTNHQSCAHSNDLLSLLTDIDGDGLPDIVMTAVCFDLTLDNSLWRVHKNDGSGFATVAENFTMPPGYGSSAFDATVDTSCNNATDLLFELVDMNDDGAPDMVITGTCGAADAIGDTEWLVHWNEGTRFSPQANTWALPDGYGPDRFRKTSNSQCPTADQYRFSLRDMHGDGLPDLLVYHGCEFTGPLGDTEWYVHKNNGAGFDATPEIWTLPTMYGTWEFDYLSFSGCGTPKEYPFELSALTNVDGDPEPELVVTWTCGSGADVVQPLTWHVHDPVCDP